ncbi:MAG TPA: hypothetical protein VGR89_09625 [Puia sp.]|nr:hypothetical protein [Puia sp.]
MRIALPLILLLCISAVCGAQKKALDPQAYDGWQRISERSLSNDGRWSLTRSRRRKAMASWSSGRQPVAMQRRYHGEPARWITDGVPATLKGIDWGLGTP